MSFVAVAIQPPETETSSFVRPIVKSTRQERGAISSDAELKLAADFVRSLSGEYASEVIEQTIAVLHRARGEVRELPIPTISPAPDGVVGMTWESAREHVNVQVHPDRRLEFFAEDLESRALWSDESAWNSWSAGLAEHLRRVR